ncbi:eukaryotic translation initiation factor 5B-like [Panicum virgatum]|uniref:Uncharacterized protein n=1 Tax=Panicum virgatum TaxID=38727 RepID=A0A8T0RXP1_PANVG|nr:eukaryotic translation initiation factor 5B-like [Panicum virgatum]KAG2589548.1 hypothetical protein PVAP13_5NG128100 [Panicum virgatum]
MAAAGKPDPATPPQPPSAAKGVFMRRIFPFLLATNVFIGVYVFAKTYKRDQEKKNAEAAAAAAAAAALSTPASATAKAADPVPAPAPAPTPKIVLPPLSEDEQRQVYKWMLEEKRKIKPRNAAEKNKINEEKALLKEFIRAESLPRL